MFDKILIAEDHDMVNLSLRHTLTDLQLPLPDPAYHSHQALSMLERALREADPYDLLITDLYFEAEGTAKQLPDGIGLIQAARSVQPGLKILVFSAESRPATIRMLFDELKINGYVRKARGDAHNLRTALEYLAQNRTYYPRELRAASGNDQLHSFTAYDKTIIRLVAEGHKQRELPEILDAMGITPSGLSSMEKRLKLIRTTMGFANNNQLVAFCTEMGLI